jgi:hypothetical protein
MTVKKVILVLLILRVAAPLSLAGYVWYRNRGQDVSLNFEKIVCGDIYTCVAGLTPARAQVLMSTQ